MCSLKKFTLHADPLNCLQGPDLVFLGMMHMIIPKCGSNKWIQVVCAMWMTVFTTYQWQLSICAEYLDMLLMSPSKMWRYIWTNICTHSFTKKWSDVVNYFQISQEWLRRGEGQNKKLLNFADMPLALAIMLYWNTADENLKIMSAIYLFLLFTKGGHHSSLCEAQELLSTFIACLTIIAGLTTFSKTL